ncbi:MAG: radical SAM protein [bacterium]
MTNPLIITEIYPSIQGESSYAGLPCTFIRLTGCPLRCRWCDTTYSFEGGKPLTVEDILAQVGQHGIPLVELTGGEPLAQKETIKLAQMLGDQGYKVLIETGGSEDVSQLDARVHIIMDIKCPGSGMVDRNLWSNIDSLKTSDEIKFVIAHREDYDWALRVINGRKLERFNLLFSPAFGLLQPKQLAEWMVEDKVKARLNLQQHKYIWHPRAKGV